MVIDVFVHVEGPENVECVAEVDFPGDSDVSPKDREKMSGADYGVHMHNRHDPILVVVKFWFDDPHAVVGVGVVKGFGELVDECA